MVNIQTKGGRLDAAHNSLLSNRSIICVGTVPILTYLNAALSMLSISVCTSMLLYLIYVCRYIQYTACLNTESGVALVFRTLLLSRKIQKVNLQVSFMKKFTIKK